MIAEPALLWGHVSISCPLARPRGLHLCRQQLWYGRHLLLRAGSSSRDDESKDHAHACVLPVAPLMIERDEAAFIHMVEDQGGTLDHRPDIDSRAILQVAVAG